MNCKENILRSIRFEKPESIPMVFHINAACWTHYDTEALLDLVNSHRYLFPVGCDVSPTFALNARANAPYTDPWKCVWTTTEDGITGSVHEHPLASWDSFEGYTAPDPEHTEGTFPINWEDVAADVRAARATEKIVWGSLPHGHMFLRVQDIRGYENFIFDMMDEEPRILRLLDMVETFNSGTIDRWLKLNPDVFSFPEDLGMQVGPMIPPDLFRKYIKPSYARLMKKAQDAGALIEMHSDGDIRTLADDLVDAGVQAINLQDLVNGIDWIAARFKGKTCVHLDIDRQQITPFGSPESIDRLVREEVSKIGTPQGGLMMIYGLYPGIPLKNVKALMDAMERYAGYYS
jgi:uroporphyrinogen decarboxylase